MAFLRQLRIIERLVRSLEIGAAILAIGIEKQRIQMAIKIVVVRDIPPRAAAQVELLKMAPEKPQQPLRLRPSPRRTDAALAEDETKKVGYRTFFDHKRPVHIGFTELELGVDQDAKFGRR